MTSEDILKLRDTAEQTSIQFKERITSSNKQDISSEMAALSNTHGGKIIIGINDKEGKINPLTFHEVQQTTNILGNLASEGVVPSIIIDMENVSMDSGVVVVATIKKGLNKPYRDSKGVVWVKQGSDKCKVFDNSELAEMMTDCGNFIPDVQVVQEASISDLDENTLKIFLSNKFSTVLKEKGFNGDALKESSLDDLCNIIASEHDINLMLRNLRFIRPNGQLTMTAILLFAKYTQRWLPMMTAKCISFYGNSIGGSNYRDKINDNEIEGNLLHQYNTIMAFLTRNLKNIQTSENFNSLGELEIPLSSLIEFVVNALVHRSLNLLAPIRILIFDDRIEIHSPGTLPNGLSINDITSGTSMPRNMFLFNNAIHLLPYLGAGSGIQRAIKNCLSIQFDNNESLREFVVTILRKSNQEK